MKTAQLISSLITSLFMLSCQGESAQKFENLAAPKFLEALQNSTEEKILVDVRTPGEFASGHIEGAKLIPVTEDGFLEAFNDIPKEQPIYLYCRSGSRSGTAAGMLAKLGFQKAFNLEGGIMAWQKNGFPVVK